MTGAELEEIRERHEPAALMVGGQYEDDDDRVCASDGDEWPCDAYKLRAEVERLRGVVDRARWEHFAFLKIGKCITCDTPWRCPTAAALEEGGATELEREEQDG